VHFKKRKSARADSLCSIRRKTPIHSAKVDAGDQLRNEKMPNVNSDLLYRTSKTLRGANLTVESSNLNLEKFQDDVRTPTSPSASDGGKEKERANLLGEE